MYCMEYIQENIDWLIDKIKEYGNERYLIFDCPGQVELYIHSDIMTKMTHVLQKRLDLRITCVHLMDSILCRDLTSYISSILTSLTCTLNLELPHINILTKNFYTDLNFRLDYYLGVEDLRDALKYINNEN